MELSVPEIRIVDTASSYRSMAREAEESVLERIQETARERVSAAAFSWMELSLRELVSLGAEYQRRSLPRSLRRVSQINLRSRNTEYFVRGRVSRLLDRSDLLLDSEDISLVMRPRTVARTEVNAALFFGRHELIWQLIGRGILSPEQITKEWIAVLDRRTRDSHVGLHRQVRPWGVPFVSPLTGVSLDHPHDSSAPASEVINCRCTENIRISM